jgi:hypothetical protein
MWCVEDNLTISDGRPIRLDLYQKSKQTYHFENKRFFTKIATTGTILIMKFMRYGSGSHNGRYVVVSIIVANLCIATGKSRAMPEDRLASRRENDAR